jgi:hypothetical protein
MASKQATTPCLLGINAIEYAKIYHLWNVFQAEEAKVNK